MIPHRRVNPCARDDAVGMRILVVHRGPSIPLASFLTLDRAGVERGGAARILAPSFLLSEGSLPSISLRLSLREYSPRSASLFPVLALLSSLSRTLFFPRSLLYNGAAVTAAAAFLQLTFVKMTFIIIAAAGRVTLASRRYFHIYYIYSR